MARILLIDDDSSVRDMLSLTLEHFGHTVIQARNGQEGLRLFPGSAVDLVITDIVMPEVEGIGVVMGLRKLQPDVKIIAISGGGRTVAAGHYLQMAKRLGAVAVLAKPFSNDELITVLAAVLAPSAPPPAANPPGALG